MFAMCDLCGARKQRMLFAMKNRIREHRKARGWTLDHLADLVGTSKGHLSDIETGKREASVSMLRRIGKALGVTDVEMFDPVDEDDYLLMRLLADFPRLSADDRRAVVRHAHSLVPPGDD